MQRAARGTAVALAGVTQHQLRVDASPGMNDTFALLDAIKAIPDDGLAGRFARSDGVDDLCRRKRVACARAGRPRHRDVHGNGTQFLPARAAVVPAMRPNTAPDVRPDPPG